MKDPLPKMATNVIPLLYTLGALPGDRQLKKMMGIREDKVCKCGNLFSPDRAGHFLCPPCFNKRKKK